jgi:hypothetical protein
MAKRIDLGGSVDVLSCQPHCARRFSRNSQIRETAFECMLPVFQEFSCGFCIALGKLIGIALVRLPAVVKIFTNEGSCNVWRDRYRERRH